MQAEGKIQLSGFDIDSSEIERVQEILQNYEKKLERIGNYEIKINLKKSQKTEGKMFLHNLKASGKINNNLLTAETQDYNLYKALAILMEKILHEAEHIIRKK